MENNLGLLPPSHHSFTLCAMVQFHRCSARGILATLNLIVGNGSIAPPPMRILLLARKVYRFNGWIPQTHFQNTTFHQRLLLLFNTFHCAASPEIQDTTERAGRAGKLASSDDKVSSSQDPGVIAEKGAKEDAEVQIAGNRPGSCRSVCNPEFLIMRA